MANYSDTEIQTAVEKVVLSSVRNLTGILGERKLEISFNDLQEAAAGVYVLYTNAPFYTVALGTTRLLDALHTQARTLSELVGAVKDLGRAVTPVEDVSSLANARSALTELEGAVDAREGGFSDISQVPAFRRYVVNLTRFITENGGNIKGMVDDVLEGGGIEESTAASVGVVDTPQGAKAKIPGLVRALFEQHNELIRRVQLLSGAIDDFSKMQLPKVAAQGVISRAREVLDSHYTELAALSPSQRLEKLRAVVLDLLTQQPLVEKYGAALAPSSYILTSGSAQAYSDGSHPGNVATVTSSKYGPYPLTSADHTLTLAVDGGAPFDYALPLSLIAELQGTVAEPYLIDSSNNLLRILFGNPDSSPTIVDVTLAPATPGVPMTAVEVAAQINAELAGLYLTCEAVFFPLRYSSNVLVISLGGTNARFTVMAGSMSGLGITVGYKVDILDGPDAGTTWTITAVDPAGQYVDASGLAPITPVGLPDGVAIKIGAANRVLLLRDTNEASSLTVRRAIQLPTTSSVHDLCVATLGWYPGAYSRSRPVAAVDLASNIENSLPEVGASVVNAPLHYTGTAKASVTDGGLVILSKFEGEATTTGGTLGVTFTFATDVAGVTIGDRLVIRESLVPGEINLEGAVTGVNLTAQTITADLPSVVAAGDMLVEVGPFVVFQFGSILTIVDGPNAGRYPVREAQGVGTTCSFELLVEGALPVSKVEAVAATFNVELGEEYVVLKSRSTLLDSDITVWGTSGGSHLFTLPGPHTAIGSTPYLIFDTFPKGAQLGDMVEFFTTDFSAADEQRAITRLEQSARLLKVDDPVANSFSIPFNFNTPIPFGRIRAAKLIDYELFRTRLAMWLAYDQQQASYFKQLYSLLNPILIASNPQAYQVNDAVVHLEKLLATLTSAGATSYGYLLGGVITEGTLEYALREYTVPAEEPVDALLASFRSKGADRAIDLLLEGQFSTFFGLNAEGVSYSGALVSGIREMAREDLPVRKLNRGVRNTQSVIGATQGDTDFEFSSADADSPGLPDPPVGG